jgi:tRNA G18 (ribose-2'-O)-methylase SpoU
MSDEGIAVCDVLYAIEQYGSTRSMNASAAGAIAMYHWALQHLPRKS